MDTIERGGNKVGGRRPMSFNLPNNPIFSASVELNVSTDDGDSTSPILLSVPSNYLCATTTEIRQVDGGQIRRSTSKLNLTPLSLPYHSELCAIRPPSTPTTSGEWQDTAVSTSASLSTPPIIRYEDLTRNFGNGSSADAESTLSAGSIVEITIPLLRQYVDLLWTQEATFQDKCHALDGILYLVEQAWSLPTVGREVAYELCDALKINGGLDILLSNVVTQEPEKIRADDPIVLMSLLILSQSMSVRNRRYVAQRTAAVESLIRLANSCKSSVERWRQLIPGITGILECLFKESDETCRLLIKMGALDVILYACRRGFDNRILRNCAAALANLAMYSTSETQREMASHKALDWLFPLTLSGDDTVSYYALIAITALATNAELEAATVKSGTLKMVEPFVMEHDPVDFGQKDKDHSHGQSDQWLIGLVHFLKLKNKWPEVLLLASFHFAVEASIRKRQGKLKVFYEIGAVEPLKAVVLGKYKLASTLAAQALTIIGETVPRVLSPKVPLWTTEEVRDWVKQIRMSDDVSKRFEELLIDGDLLLQLTENDLINDLAITDGIVRKRFLRELSLLQRSADYASCDETGLAAWLNACSPDLRRYTYLMLSAGIDTNVLSQLDETHLINECKIANAVHRMLILTAVRRRTKSTCNTPKILDETDNRSATGPNTDDNKTFDAFISYRRRNGKHLAGLLKVYLAQRGINVYLDIESMRIGRFDENLVKSIKRSTNFVLILTADALDNCIGDDQCNDWVHKEIVAALEAGCKIIPVMDQDFKWPDDKSLPADIRDVSKYQGIEWVHQWQEACAKRLVDYVMEGCQKQKLPEDSQP